MLKFSYTSHIPGVQKPNVPSDYHIRQHKYETCLLSQKILLDSTTLGLPWSSPLYFFPLARKKEDSPPRILQDRRKHFQDFSSSLSY